MPPGRLKTHGASVEEFLFEERRWEAVRQASAPALEIR
ncbi:hypothetical protein EDD30_4397 [Couchioplanes caeruleus]|uniref:Uncharacterized protein n=1 Tax=Couchioplanes caeruleus TaxID=56438 RepID=A0A3N1GN03_9ACTN|nr:hypothetical protein EDD30_4397 [Couchioplanes caeruleus]